MPRVSSTSRGKKAKCRWRPCSSTAAQRSIEPLPHGVARANGGGGMLLDHGAEVDARQAEGGTPLHLDKGADLDPAMVTLLLDRGAEVDAKSTDRPPGATCWAAAAASLKCARPIAAAMHRSASPALAPLTK